MSMKKNSKKKKLKYIVIRVLKQYIISVMLLLHISMTNHKLIKKKINTFFENVKKQTVFKELIIYTMVVIKWRIAFGGINLCLHFKKIEFVLLRE